MNTDVSFATFFMSMLLAIFLGAGAVMWALDECARRDVAEDDADTAEEAAAVAAERTTDTETLSVASQFHATTATRMAAASERKYERAILTDARVRRP